MASGGIPWTSGDAWIEFAGGILVGGDEDMLGTEDVAVAGVDGGLFDVGDAASRLDGIVRKACPQLIGNGLHAACWQRSVSLGEHGEDKFEHDAGGSEFLLEEDAAEEGTEKAIDEVLRKSFLFEKALCGEFLMCIELIRLSEEEAAFEERYAKGVAKFRIRKAQGIEECGRVAEGVGEFAEVCAIPDASSRDKVTEPEGIEIEGPFDFRIGGLENLESVVQAKAVDGGGPDPAADGIRGLNDADFFAGLLEESGSTQASDSGTDYYDIAICLSFHWLRE